MNLFENIRGRINSYMVESDIPQSEDNLDANEERDDDQDGSHKDIVDVLIKNAPKYRKLIGSLLKYAANSTDDYTIFDSALDYYESIKDGGESEDIGSVEDESVEDDIDNSNLSGSTQRQKPKMDVNLDL